MSRPIPWRLKGMLRFHPHHCWLKAKNGRGLVGLTPYAVGQLGEIIYVDLPAAGQRFKQGEEFGLVESTKATAGLITPVSGLIAVVNVALEENVAWLNDSPLYRGWLAVVDLDDRRELDGLLDRAAYEALTAGEE